MPRIKKEDKQASKIAQLEYDLKDSENARARYANLLGAIRSLFPGAEERDILKRVVDLMKELAFSQGKNDVLTNMVHLIDRDLRVSLKDKTLKENNEDPLTQRFNR